MPTGCVTKLAAEFCQCWTSVTTSSAAAAEAAAWSKRDLMATQQISCAQGREKLMLSFGSPCASNNCALGA